MRSVAAKTIGVLLLLGLLATGLMLFWVSEAVANIMPSSICLSERTRAYIARGTLPVDQQDSVVTKTVQFRTESRGPSVWWHLKVAAIYYSYVTFWSEEDRKQIFNKLAPQLRTCPRGFH